MPACPACGADALDIDVKCGQCGAALGATGAHRMLGQVMLGQYELVDVLGQGGMSVVFKGRHKLTEQEVALKILPPELAAHSQVKSRFLEEAKALAALDHPNIVHLYNFGQENGFFVLAMQYVKGSTWERIILENKRMDWQASCRVTIDVLKALEYAHDHGVIHRDMKPSNVLVRAHDAVATVMDFGIAKMTTSTKLTATGQTMGTVRYMSPEQVRGQEVDLRTDLYSLGATLYESLTGDTPFDGETHFEIMTKHLTEVPKRPSTMGIEVPELVEEALMKSLAKKPGDRHENARDMRKILEAALRDGDLGLSETQKVNRQVLGELRPVAKPTAATVPVRAASSLADVLEPGTSGEVPKRGKALWIGLAAVILAGGAAAAALVLRGHPSTPAQEIVGYQPAATATIGTLSVQSGGKVAPAEVAARYQDVLAQLRTFAKAKGVEIPDPIQEIVTIPQQVFCEPTAYPDRKVPDPCATLTAKALFGPKNQRRLLILDDPAHLQKALSTEVPRAACIFELDEKRSAAVCEVSKEFISSVRSQAP